MPSVSHRVGRVFSLVGVLLLILAFAPPVAGWGSSVHHDQAITISDSLKNTPSIPAEVRENIDTDTIYSASLAPDDWRDATGVWGTYQWNMAENAVLEFRRIRDAWAESDFDNAIVRIGVVLHYVGDAMEMEHSHGLRGSETTGFDPDGYYGTENVSWYRKYVSPLGSDQPLWSTDESGGQLYPHHVRHQMEAYTDSDTVWYPRKPENYGPTDDGSLDWFLNNYFYDSDLSDYDTVMDQLIWQTNPFHDLGTGDPEVDNRWFYWVDTRDPDISKMDADNTIRLTYNGVYRALRDGEYWRKNPAQWGNPPPADWTDWDWPTKGAWDSPRTYGNGYDTIRWVEGQREYGSGGGESEQGAEVPSAVGVEIGALLAAGLAVAAVGILYARHLWQGKRKSKLEKVRGRRS